MSIIQSVFQCSECKNIIGDSNSLVYCDESENIITLRSISL